jgi:hypothetical protein
VKVNKEGKTNKGGLQYEITAKEDTQNQKQLFKETEKPAKNDKGESSKENSIYWQEVSSQFKVGEYWVQHILYGDWAHDACVEVKKEHCDVCKNVKQS